MDANSIQEIAVLGLGTMGHGIAQTFALAGCRVRGYDASVSARETLHDRIRDNLRSASHAGLVDESQIADALPRIEACDTEAGALEGAQFVVEAVAEDLAVKQDRFERIEAMVDDETILASNSSSHPISSSGSRLKLPQRAVVTHWFNPPHIIPTVEVVGGPETSEDTIVTAVDLHRRIGKLAVRVNKELPGFLVNRVQIAMIREVWDLLEQGVARQRISTPLFAAALGFVWRPLGLWRSATLPGSISGTEYSAISSRRSDRTNRSPRPSTGWFPKVTSAPRQVWDSTTTKAIHSTRNETLAMRHCWDSPD